MESQGPRIEHLNNVSTFIEVLHDGQTWCSTVLVQDRLRRKNIKRVCGRGGNVQTWSPISWCGIAQPRKSRVI